MRDILNAYIALLADSPLAPWAGLSPWDVTSNSDHIVAELVKSLPVAEYEEHGHDVMVHRSSTVEKAAVLKGPLIVGPNCFVAAGAYVRGGSWMAGDCTLGPGSELKSSLVFNGTKIAHFNFVGDSILGADVNLEAGSIICNYRNECDDKEILVLKGGTLVKTGCQKFGALVGDGCRVGANAVIAPGALLRPGTVVNRGALLDQGADHDVY